MAHRAGTTAQRVRIGLTGLAFAFLLVLLGSIISRSGRDEHVAAIDNAVTNTPTELGVAPGSEPPENETPTEPLAKLGVAPGSEPPENSSSNRQ